MTLGFYAASAVWNAALISLCILLLLFAAPASRVKWPLLLVATAAVEWSVFFALWTGATSADDAMFYQRVFSIGGTLAVPATLHVTYAFLERPIRARTLVLNYGFVVVTNIINFTTHAYVSGFAPLGPIPFYPRAGWFHPITLLYLGGTLAWSYILLRREMRDPKSVRTPQQIKWLLLGIAFGWISGSLTYPGFYGIAIEPVLTPCASLLTVCFVYGMLRHKLFDVEFVFRRAVVFAVLLAIVTAALVIVTGALPVFLHDHGVAIPVIWINVVAFIALFYALQPVRRRLIDWTDRYLFQREIDYGVVLAKIAREGGRFADSKELTNALVDQVVAGLRVHSAALYLSNAASGELELRAARGGSPADRLAKDNPLVETLDLKRHPIGIDLRLARAQQDGLDVLATLGGRLALPIFNGNALDGVLVIGEQRSEKPYTQADLDALVPLSRLIGVLLANALLRQDLKVAQARVAEAAVDALTGVFVRAALLEQVAVEAIRARYFARPFAILMADLDFFKAKNDTYGHPAGDLILKEAATRMRGAVRPSDLVGRYGGEEFLIYLGGATRAEAMEIAERIRQRIGQDTIDLGTARVTQTVSIGISCFPDDSEDLDRLIERADGLLYEAKHAGRNSVVSRPRTRRETATDAVEPALS